MTRDLGDFQTPPGLADAVLKVLGSIGDRWPRVLEPTCGHGSFIKALLALSPPPREVQGIEIQAGHVLAAQRLSEEAGHLTHVVVRHGNLFQIRLDRDLNWSQAGPLLVVGNPPWITNAELGSLGSSNLPRKTNLKNLKGIEARTGDSNFDIAEYIWIKLITELVKQEPTIALLCKTSVARNVLKYAADMRLPVSEATIWRFDAKRWFDASTDACLFSVKIGRGPTSYEANVFSDLDGKTREARVGVVGGRLVSDMTAYERSAVADGVCPLEWRQGVKHDAAAVMELSEDEQGQVRNGLGEVVAVEEECIYPLLKCSDLFGGVSAARKRKLIVTQRRLGEDTRGLARRTPRLWEYLTTHAGAFDSRKSSIYRGQPRFALFGIGDYSFSPFKVGVSGLHKIARFRCIGPVGGRPVMLDDTCYFLPSASASQAALLACLLNEPLCVNLIRSISFADSKRPITKRLLQRIDLGKLLERADSANLFARAEEELDRLGVQKGLIDWPKSLETCLRDPNGSKADQLML